MATWLLAAVLSLRAPDGHSHQEAQCAACVAVATEVRDEANRVFVPHSVSRGADRRTEVLEGACKRMKEWIRTTSNGRVQYRKRYSDSSKEEAKEIFGAKAAQFKEGSLVELQRELRDFCYSLIEDHEDAVDRALLDMGVEGRLDEIPRKLCVDTAKLCSRSAVPAKIRRRNERKRAAPTKSKTSQREAASFLNNLNSVVDGESMVKEVRKQAASQYQREQRRKVDPFGGVDEL